MSRVIRCSASGFEAWLPPPEDWRLFACERCPGDTRAPFPPSDGLCGDCRTRERRKAAEKTVEQMLAEAGAPCKFAVWTRRRWERRYGAWTDQAELRLLDGWPHAHERRSWLVLITGRGFGCRRTELATAVLGEAMSPWTGSAGVAPKRGLRGRWLTQSDWLMDIRASWDGRRSDRVEVDPEHVVWRRAAQAEVLLFDDLGSFGGFQQVEKAWWRRQVTELLHYRERHQLPTVVTANLADWRQVGRIHESLVPRMNVRLKIHLEDAG